MRATDEEGRPWYVDLDLVHTVLFSVAFVILAWLLHYLISISSHYLDTPDPTTTLPQTPAIISLENLAPGKSPRGDPTLAFPRSHAPLFPDHQALVDIDNPKWSWQDVGEELDIEDIFFNQDSQSLVALLSHIEAQDAHPKSLQKVFKGI